MHLEKKQEKGIEEKLEVFVFSFWSHHLFGLKVGKIYKYDNLYDSLFGEIKKATDKLLPIAFQNYCY